MTLSREFPESELLEKMESEWTTNYLTPKDNGESDGKEFICNAGDLDSISSLGRSPGEENGNPLQYSCLMDRGA